VTRHVYVHVPFCARRCSYCDFSIAVRREVPVDEYLRALDAELTTRFGNSRVGQVDTIYFGGGTPSRLGGEGLARAVALVAQRFAPDRETEITVEANPEDLTPESARRWKAAGVNRLSIGSQSFDDRALQWMHRTHDAAAIGRAVETARAAGIDNLSLDLIFALPQALERDFARDVDRVLALAPDHVSLYGLTVEAGTPLGRWVARGAAVEQPEDAYASDFLTAHRLLGDAGFEHYEVSNYARPGRRARHNSAYWSGAAYVGLGPAAHGFDGRSRRWNARAYAAWSELSLTGADPIEGSESLTEDNKVAEAIYLGLRSDSGLEITAADLPAVSAWINAGWAHIPADGRLRCTPEGWLRLDALAAALTSSRSR
jgi:oxygen-independent coproporphyrinogen-3 oxidase